MNSTRTRLVLAVLGGIAMLAGIIYALQTFPSSSRGYHVPSPDETMAAKIMRVHKKPAFGKGRHYYKISLYGEYSPGKMGVKPILTEEHPLTIADNQFELTRDCIQWNMEKRTVTFDFGRTKIEKSWSK